MGSTRGTITGIAAAVAAGSLVGVIVAGAGSGTDCLDVDRTVADRIASAGPIRITTIGAVHGRWIERRDQYGFDTYHVIAAEFTAHDGRDYVGTWAYGSDGDDDEVPAAGTIMAIDEPARQWTTWGPPTVAIEPDERAAQAARSC